ncbi:MAG: aminotransferase class IV family protein [Saprospiraceae bacterium]|nr:aminotransferase class IV family protein [Saprospiraceae bacterium]
MINYHFLNGKIVSETSACLPLSDLGIGRGYGIFDYFQVKQGVPLYLDEHLERMQNSCRTMRLPLVYSLEEFKIFILELIQINRLTEAGMKIIVTGGTGQGFSLENPNVAIQVLPFGQAKKEWMERGAPLISHEYQRPVPHAKTTNYMMAVYLQNKVDQAGAVEPLYYTRTSVRESSRANVFAVFGKKLVTPAHEILTGITRKHTIAWAKNHVELEIRDITLEELVTADEVFLTGTMKMGLPITQIDGDRIGAGVPGPMTKTVQQMLLNYEEQYIATFVPVAT